jgi:hypothetical protein
MAKYNNSQEKSILQIVGSSFIIIAGLFAMLVTANSITGNVIGDSGNINITDIAVVFWGLLTIGVGIWVIRKKDFSKSIFNK